MSESRERSTPVSEQHESAPDLEPIVPRRRTRRQKIGLFLAIFAIAAVSFGVILIPGGAGHTEATNATGDLPVTPTVGITGQVEVLALQRKIELDGIEITLLKATLAEKFTDDHKRNDDYVLRVDLTVANPGDTPLGIRFSEVTQLIAADGAQISFQRTSVMPVAMPRGIQTGYLDFPVKDVFPLNTFSLRIDSQVISFKL